LYLLNRLCGFSSFFGQVRFMSTQLVLSPPFSFPGATSPPVDVVTPPCRVTLPSHWVKMSSLPPLHLPVTLCPVASPLESKLKHWITPPSQATLPGSPDSYPPLLQKDHLNLGHSPTTKSCFHFASSLARAPCHLSATRRHHSLSPLSHTYHPSAQWHPQWRTSQSSFASRTPYWHVNSRKEVFWNAAASRGVYKLVEYIFITKILLVFLLPLFYSSPLF
jgi:hypothetical protein